MLIVAGHLLIDPADREAHVAASAEAVRHARTARGCRDFAVSADPVDPGRVNVFERWDSAEDLEAFRRSGDDSNEAPVVFSRIREIAVEQYELRR